MTTEQIIGIVAQIVPDIMRFIKDYRDRNDGSLPTDQDVINKLNADATRVLSISDKWLKEHPNA